MQYTNLVDIDAVLPPDVPIKWRGKNWLIPGDIETGKMLALEQALDALKDAGESGGRDAAVEAFDRLAQCVQGILAVRQPEEAADLTFGSRELGILAMTMWASANGKLKRPAPAEEQPADGDEGNGQAAAAQ